MFSSIFGTATPEKENTSTNGASASHKSYDFDEPEADYDDGATALYKLIENKNWDSAIQRAQNYPEEARTWVSRKDRRHDGGHRGKGGVRWRLLPLHATCVFRSPLSLIEALIEAYPDGAQMKDDQGMLPVHLACRNGASKGVVTTLLHAFPNSLQVEDRKGRLPLTFVEQSSSQNKEAVLLAIKKFQREVDRGVISSSCCDGPTSNYSTSGGGTGAGSTVGSVSLNSHGPNSNPAGVAEVDYEHRTILFRLILKKDWNAVIQRAAKYPDEAATWIVTKGFNGNLRFLPIHKACVLAPPETAIDSLLDAFPDGARCRDQDGWLPLHCACFYGATENTVRALLAANSAAAQSKDDEGRLPLHYGCLKGSSDPVVIALLAAFSKGAMIKDGEGRLPIHHACSKGATEAVVEALLKASPKGAQTRDDQGRLALHHACRKSASEGVVRVLLRVYPRAAQIKDDQDKLPIHYVCQSSSGTSSVRVVETLLAAFPESVNVKNGFGYTPLDEAKAADDARMAPIITALETFTVEQERSQAENGGTGGSASNADTATLRARVESLENAMKEIASAAKALKVDLDKKGTSKKDASVGPVKIFADRLVKLVEDTAPKK